MTVPNATTRVYYPSREPSSHHDASPCRTPQRRQWIRRCGVRVTQPQPGAYAGLVSWQSRHHYLTVVVEMALRLRPEPLTCHRVSADTFRAYAAALAAAADHTSGRGIERTNDQFAETIGCASRTIRRCRAVAEDLGLYILITPGRLMTRPERIRAWRAGSAHRGLANSAALVIPSWLLPHLLQTTASPVDNSAGHTPPGDNVHPPLGTAVGSTNEVTTWFIAHSATTGSAGKDNHSPKKRPTNRPRAGYRLACRLVERVPWLQGVQPGRLAPQLARYQRAGWTVDHLTEAMDHLHQRLGWASPSHTSIRGHRWGLLRWYLSNIDPQADHPRAASNQRHTIGTQQLTAYLADHHAAATAPTDPDRRASCRQAAYAAARHARQTARDNGLTGPPTP